MFLLFLFWAGLFFLGFPPPNIDDLFFSGTAIQLIKDGSFHNPYLLSWTPLAREGFFFQPPFHSYILAAWLFLFGVSTKSFLAFQCVCCFIFSYFTIHIFNQNKFPKILGAIVPLFFCLWMMNRGFRQDALGFAFLAAGIWLLSQERLLPSFFGFVFIGSSFLTAPIAVAYALPLSFLFLIKNYCQSQEKKNHILQHGALLFLAIGMVSFLFLWAIHFRLSEFLSVFFWHASTRRVPLEKVPNFLLSLLTHGKDALILGPSYFLLFPLFGFFCLHYKKVEIKIKVAVFTLITCLMLHLVFYLDVLYGALFFFTWVLNGILIFCLPFTSKQRFWISGIGSVCLLLSQSTLIVSWMGRQPDPDPKSLLEIRHRAEQAQDKILVVDEIAARYVFDFKLPKNTVNWNFLGPAPRHWPTNISQKTVDSIWIIAEAKTLACDGLPKTQLVTLWGKTFTSLSATPKKIVWIGNSQ